MVFVVLLIQAQDGPITYNLADVPMLFEKNITEYNRSYIDKEDIHFHCQQFKNNFAKINIFNEKSFPQHYILDEFAYYSKQDMLSRLSKNDYNV